MEAALVVKVTAALVSTLTKFASEKLFTSIQKRYEKWKSVDGDIHFIKTELGMIVATLESQFLQGVNPNGVHAVSMNTLRDLAYDIEDCFDRFLLSTSCEGHDVPFLSDFPSKIQGLKKRLMDARQQILDYASINHGNPTAAVSASTRAPLPKVKKPLGIDKPKKELVDLLRAEEEEKPRVISIVGFGGSGKTRLAREVYDHFVADGNIFLGRAWVEAWRYKIDDKGLLLALVKQLVDQRQYEDMVDSDVENIQAKIIICLNTKRSLVVFDGIDEQQCNAILPMKSSCNIIVTTTSQQVANRCTYDGGYIYSTSTLEKKDCDDLLKEILSSENSSDLEQISASIIKRCDGHPLSLVSVANFLQSATGNSRSKSCEKVCRLLGSYVEKQSAFHELREVLMRNYGNLSGPLIKTCLLYMSIFPKGFQIRRKSLIRRWVAEGYIQSEYGDSDETAAHENFENLLDQNIIEPMGACDNARVKTCRTHSVMREFMLHRSFCDHFIGSLDTLSESDDPSTFRHLFIQNCTNINILRLAKKKLCARSLTIFGSGGEAAVSCIAECELLQALDLKECNDFDDNLVKGIMKDNLSRLKYLSLGSATTTLPDSVDKLHCLHTLELSKTNVVALPIEVLELPHLVHLFGKVVLRKSDSLMKKLLDITSNKESIIAEKSNLQSLAGFVIDKDSIIPQLMVHMKRLRKVKVWCDSTSKGTTDWMNLKKAIENFVTSEMDTAVGERSLSLYLGDGLERFPELGDNIKVELNGFVSSLKLQGKLNQLPNFDTSLNGITKLCLSSTNLEGRHYSDLGKLLCLKYLKLVENYLGGFVIKIGTFPSLEFLCLLMPSFLYAVPEIEEGALPKLVSLQLLCKHLHGLAGINIKNHTKLQEVALDSAVSMETINTWENEAQKHPKRPKVLFFKRVGTSKIKYTATERPKTPESTGAGDSMEIDN